MDAKDLRLSGLLLSLYWQRTISRVSRDASCEYLKLNGLNPGLGVSKVCVA